MNEYETLALWFLSGLGLSVHGMGRGLHNATVLSHHEPPALIIFSHYVSSSSSPQIKSGGRKDGAWS